MAQTIRVSPLIKGSQVGTITEKVSFPCWWHGPFFNDSGPSLREALALLSLYSPLTGLKVNWDKSLSLPIDGEAEARSDPDLPLRWTASAKYLGVLISPKTSDYVTLNLLPLLNLTKQNLLAWSYLPLSLVGRIKLIKLKLLPYILYILCHALVWIPRKYFRQFESVVFSFLWGAHRPRFRLSVLQRPWTEGSLACPNLFTYNLTALLTWAHSWLVSDEANAAMVLEATELGSDEALCNILYRGKSASFLHTQSMTAIIKAW